MQSICVALVWFRDTTTSKVEVRVGKLRNGNAAGKNKVTGEMIKGGGDRVVDWSWMLFI